MNQVLQVQLHVLVQLLALLAGLLRIGCSYRAVMMGTALGDVSLLAQVSLAIHLVDLRLVVAT